MKHIDISVICSVSYIFTHVVALAISYRSSNFLLNKMPHSKTPSSTKGAKRPKPASKIRAQKASIAKRKPKAAKFGVTLNIQQCSVVTNKSMMKNKQKLARAASKRGIKNDAALTRWIKSGCPFPLLQSLPNLARKAALHIMHTMRMSFVDAQVQTAAGYIDMVVKTEDGRLVVVDLKCLMREFKSLAEFNKYYKQIIPGKSPKLLNYDVPNTIENTHHIQIASYRLALRHAHKLDYTPAGFVLLPLKLNGITCVVRWNDDSFLTNGYILQCLHEYLPKQDV